MESLTDLKADIEADPKMETPTGKTSLSDLFSDSTEKSAVTEQYNFLKGTGLVSNPEGECILISNVSENASGGTKQVSELIEDLSKSDLRYQQFIDNADGVLVCDLKNSGLEDIRGFASDELRIIGVNTADTQAIRTAAEEFTHLYQEAEDLDPKKYSAASSLVWDLGTDSQAKLSVAVDAVRQKYDGDPSLFNAHRDSYGHSAESRVANHLSYQVKLNGIEALDDPEVLSKGFMDIMGTRNFIADYYRERESKYAAQTGTQTISIETFNENFGTIVGGNGVNFLDGRLKSLNEIADNIPQGMRARNMLESSLSHSAPQEKILPGLSK